MNKQRSIRTRFSLENGITLYSGPCINLLKQIPDNCVQLVITSPPYNLGRIYRNRQQLDEYLQQQSAVIDECIRILKKGASICWQVGNYTLGKKEILPLDIALHPLFACHEKTHDVHLRNRIIWHYENGINYRKRLSNRHETILWYTKGKDYLFSSEYEKSNHKRSVYSPGSGNKLTGLFEKNPGDVWSFPNVKDNHLEKTDHTCQFPVELPARLIHLLSLPGDIVVDPYMGSGTTAVAAVLLERKIAGADTNKAYLKIARKRIRQAAKGEVPIHSITDIYP